jgi:hypothetical protein
LGPFLLAMALQRQWRWLLAMGRSDNGAACSRWSAATMALVLDK